ncbi:MAG: glycosyltransferase, partial [Henriciella sp.]|nr:glycosyltransferase [Henriciella sp.]
MTNPPCFSIVIVNYNGGAYLKGALASLAAQTITDFEVFVADNASTDTSMTAVFAQYGKTSHTSSQTLGLPSLTTSGTTIPLHIRPQSKNLGFAAANNLMAKEATGEWLVLLNPDAEAAPDWLENLADAITRHPTVSMFASTQIDLH